MIEIKHSDKFKLTVDNSDFEKEELHSLLNTFSEIYKCDKKEFEVYINGGLYKHENMQ
jgi:hypothetical protein